MRTTEQEFLEEMRKTFATEAGEHLQIIASGLVEIEKQKDPAINQALTESIYRSAHSLKGAARSVNLLGVEAVCQSAESVFAAMKKGVMTPAEADFDILQRAVNCIDRMVASGTGDQDAEASRLIQDLERIAAREETDPPADHNLRQMAPEMTPAATPGPAASAGSEAAQSARREGKTPPPARAAEAATFIGPGKPAAADTIRIATAKLDSILLQAEELISIKLAAEQRSVDLAEALGVLRPWIREWEKALERAQAASRRQGKRNVAIAARTSALADSLGEGPLRLRELDTHPSFFTAHSSHEDLTRLRDLDAQLNGLLSALQTDRRATGTLVDELLEGAKNLLMLPFSTLLQTFPKMVRDISREQNKQVSLVFSGGEIEIDKRILERMKDPLIHLLRNAVDHGLEQPEARQARGKAPGGTITVDVSPAEGNRVRIRVCDDGAGIDAAMLREAAVKRGVVSREEADALDDQAALMLLFQSGVSTSPLITDISGRGLGMAIVQEAVDKLGGRITLETRKGEGTTFCISLPLTLATFRGMLLQEFGQLFAVPTSSVQRGALRVRKADVRTVENRETILVDAAPMALVRLGAALGLAPAAGEAKDRPLISVIVLGNGQQRMAFAVDSLLHEHEILIKDLGKQLLRVRNIAGATVLGSGRVVPVLNVADLMKSAVLAAGARHSESAGPEPATAENRRKSVLVAEDSITSRMLLKNILTSAGFDVHTVVDGVEAWTALKQRGFNAVVSDVEMPRMTGFDLAAKIRGDEKLAEMPLVLVTSLESRQDREHGIEVGADAYIVKSSFDQSNLLEVVQRLIGRSEA